MIILVYDGSQKISSEEKKSHQKIIDLYDKKIIVVKNKIDLTLDKTNPFENHQPIEISSTKKINLNLVENEIQKKIDNLFSSIESPFLLNKRQYNLIIGLEKKLKVIVDMLHGQTEYELVSYHLKEALEYFSEFSGKTVSEQTLDAVFKSFCVGK